MPEWFGPRLWTDFSKHSTQLRMTVWGWTIRKSLHYRETSWPSMAAPNDGPGARFHFYSLRSGECDGRPQSWRHWNACREGDKACPGESVMVRLSLVSLSMTTSLCASRYPTCSGVGLCAHAFSSAEEFLKSDYIDQTRCLILDIAMRHDRTGSPARIETSPERDSDRLHHRSQR